MPAPDRLPELLRQRALLQEHLAWLEREIAAASGQEWPTYPADAANREAPAPAKPPAAVPSPTAPTAPVPATTADEPSVAEEIIDQYRVAPDALKTDLRKGCLLYFFGALALVALGVVGLYLVFNYAK